MTMAPIAPVCLFCAFLADASTVSHQPSPMMLHLVAPPGAAPAAPNNMCANATSSLTVLVAPIGFLGQVADAAFGSSDAASLTHLYDAGHRARPPDPGGTRTRACTAILDAMCSDRRIRASGRNASVLYAMSSTETSAAESAPSHAISYDLSCNVAQNAHQPSILSSSAVIKFKFESCSDRRVHASGLKSFVLSAIFCAETSAAVSAPPSASMNCNVSCNVSCRAAQIAQQHSIHLCSSVHQNLLESHFRIVCVGWC